jgi:chromosome segregation ATPase
MQADYEQQLKNKETGINELRRRQTALETENSSLKTNFEQTLRYLRRYELKQQLTNNQIANLQKQLTEKDAIIRYLEQRTLPRPTHALPLPNDSVLDELASTYGKGELSFAKIKSTNNLKFEDYSSVRSKEEPQLGLGSRGKRVRTESTEVKENVNC